MWTYEQDTGRMLDPDDMVVATDYAGGAGGTHPEAVNNHEMQDVKGEGPLPLGKYTFGTPVEGSHLGPFAIPLIPDSDNEMFGRGSFYMHGDRVSPIRSASDGCIIMPSSVRHNCWASPDHELMVVLSGG